MLYPLSYGDDGGRRGIRTPGTVTPNGFQDRCLNHLAILPGCAQQGSNLRTLDLEGRCSILLSYGRKGDWEGLEPSGVGTWLQSGTSPLVWGNKFHHAAKHGFANRSTLCLHNHGAPCRI